MHRLEDEAERLTQQLEEAKDQLERLYTDRTHEKATLTENTNVLERLSGEEKTLLSKKDNSDEDLKQRKEAKDKQQDKVNELETVYTSLMQELASGRARKHSLEHHVRQDESRKENLESRLKGLNEQLAEAEKGQDEDRDVGKFSVQPRGPSQTGAARLAFTDMLATGLFTCRSAQVPERDP